MSARMMSPVPARIIQVLKDYLPTELDTIDTEEGDGVVTPDIRTAPNCWFPWDKKLIVEFPAFSIRTRATSPVEIRETSMGGRIDAWHVLDLMFHGSLNTTQNADPATLQKLMHRYIAGAARVLAVAHDGLDTVADPTRWGSPTVTTTLEWIEDATYGPEEQQDSGAIVRTATLPVRVRRIENR